MANVETLAWKLVADTEGFTQGVVATRAELRAAKQIIEGTLTPLEKLSRGLDEAQHLFKIGAIDVDQYNRRLSQLHNEFDRATAAEQRMASGMHDVHDAGSQWIDGQLQGLPIVRSMNLEMLAMGPHVAAAAAAFATITLAWEAASAAGRYVVNTILEQTDATLDLTRTAEQLGVRAGVLAGWRDAAGDLSGAVGGELDAALSKMNRNLAEAVEGGGPAVDTLRQLGLSARDLVAMGTESAFYVLADAIANTEGQMQRARLATDLFGKSGAQLLNTFAAGAPGLRQSVADAEEIGLALSAVDTENIVRFGESMNQLGDIAEGFGNQITASAAPGLAALATSLIDATAKGEPLRDLMDSVVVVVGNLANNMGQVADIGAMMFGPVIVAGGMVLSQINGVTQAIAALDRMAADVKGGQNDQLQAAAANLQRLTERTFAAGMEITEQGLAGEFAARMAEARKEFAASTPAVRQLGGAVSELVDLQTEAKDKAGEAAKATTDWESKAAKIHEQVRTSLEKYQDRIEELNQAVQLGGLAWADYEAAAAQAAAEYERASEVERRADQRRGAAAGEALAAERSAAAQRRQLDSERVAAVVRGTQAALDASARAQAAQRQALSVAAPPVVDGRGDRGRDLLAQLIREMPEALRPGLRDSQQPAPATTPAPPPISTAQVERLLQDNRDKIATSNLHLADIVDSLSNGLVQVREVTLR